MVKLIGVARFGLQLGLKILNFIILLVNKITDRLIMSDDIS